MGSSDDEDVHQCGRCKHVFHSIDEYFVHKKNDACQKVVDTAQVDSSEDKCREEKPPITPTVDASLVAQEGELSVPTKRRRGRPPKKSKGVVKQTVTNAALSGTAGCSSRLNDDTQHPEVAGAAENAAQEDDLPIGRRVRSSKRRRSSPKKLWLEDSDVDPDSKQDGGDEASWGVDDEDDDAPPSKRTRRGRRKKPDKPQTARSGDATLRDFDCPKCDFAVHNKEQFDRHLRRQHNLSTYVCTGCMTPFRDKYKLKRHVVQCTVKSNTLKVVDGGLIFASFIDDNSTQCTDKTESSCTEADTSALFRCNECNFEGPTYDAITEHLVSHPGLHPGICRFCGKWFASRYKLWRHMTSSVHDQVSEAAMQHANAELKSLRISWLVTENRRRGCVHRVTCHMCKIGFKTKSLLERHTRSVHAPETQRKHRCSMCKDRFSSRRILDDHLLSVHGVKGINPVSHFRCPVCNRLFTQKGHMYRHHETLHTPVRQKPYTEAEKAMDAAQRESETSHVDGTLGQQEKATAETKCKNRVDEGTCFTRKDGVIVALGEKWVTVEPTVWSEEGEQERVDTGNGDVHACFVCCRHLETRRSYLQHIELHRVWVPLPGGPQPYNLFEATTPIDILTPAASEHGDAPATRQEDGVDLNATSEDKSSASPLECRNALSADFAASRVEESKCSTLMNGIHEPVLRLTTINQSALIDMMQEHVEEEDATHKIGAASPGGEETEKEKTLEAAAAIVDLSERAARLGSISGSADIPRFSSPIDDDDCSGTARLCRTKSGKLDSEPAAEDDPSGDEAAVHQCPYCGKTTTGLEAMYSHKVTDHKIEAVFCCVQSPCGKTFNDVASYREHSRVHSQLAFICLVCNSHFDDFCDILAHKSAAHRRLYDTQRRHRCNMCSRTFFEKKTAETATDPGAQPDDYCAECSKILAGTDDVSTHEPGTDPKTFLCDQCGDTCGSRLRLKQHMRVVHRATREHRCTQCGTSFNKGEHLRRHLITKHSDERPFACKFPGCTKTFKRRDKLQEHHKAHSEARSYVCSICSRAYRYREGLRYHEKTHSRESKYRCDTCNRAFVRPGLLQEHVKAFHSDTKKAIHVYACDECNAKFPRPERVKRHMENEHKTRVEWKTHCKTCNMGFPGERSLQTHILRQHPAKPGEIAQSAIIHDQLRQAILDRQRTFTGLKGEEVTTETVPPEQHTQTFSSIVDQLLSTQYVAASDGRAVDGQHGDQAVRLHVTEPVRPGEVAESPTHPPVSCQPATPLQCALTSHALRVAAGDVGHGIQNTQSVMQIHDIDQGKFIPHGFSSLASQAVLYQVPDIQTSRPTANPQSGMTGATQVVHVMGDLLTVPVLVQGMTNDAPPGMLTAPLQQLPLLGVTTTTTATDPALLHGDAVPLAWQLSQVKTDAKQCSENQPRTWPGDDQCVVTGLNPHSAPSQPHFAALNKSSSSQAGVPALNQPLHSPHAVAVLNQSPQNIVAVLNRPSQAVFAALNQNMEQIQPNQALIAALNQTAQNQAGIESLHQQPRRLAEPPHSQTGVEALSTLQSLALISALNKPPVNQPLILPLQGQTYNCAGISSSSQPIQSQSVLATFNQSPQSQCRVSVMQQPPQTHATIIASNQPPQSQPQTVSQFGFIGMNQLQQGQPTIASLIQLPGNQSQPLRQVGLSSLNQTSQNQLQTLSQVGMLALNHTSHNQPQTLSQVGMSALNQTSHSHTQSQVGMSELNHTSQNQPQTLSQVGMSALNQTSHCQTLSRGGMSELNQTSQNQPQTVSHVGMSALNQTSQSQTQTLSQVEMSALNQTSQSQPQTVSQVVMSALNQTPKSQVGVSALNQASQSHPQTLNQVGVSALNQASQSHPQTLKQVGMSALNQTSHSQPQTLNQVGMSALNQTSQMQLQSLNQVGVSALNQTLHNQTLSQVGMSALNQTSHCQTLSRSGMSELNQTSQNQPQTVSQVGMSALNQTSQSQTQTLSQVEMSALNQTSQSQPQTVSHVVMSALNQTPKSQVGVSALNNTSQSQVGMSALNQTSHSQPQTLNKVGMSALNQTSHSQPQTLNQVGMCALNQISQMQLQSLNQVGVSALNQTLHNQTLSQVEMSALNQTSQSQPQILSQVGVSAFDQTSQNQPRTLNQFGMSVLNQTSQNQPETLSQIGMSALNQTSESQQQTLSQAGMSALNQTSESQQQTLSQVGVSALNQTSQSQPQTLSQVGMPSLIHPHVNRCFISTITPQAVPLQSILKPTVQSCITPVCSPRCVASSTRVIPYPGPAAHSSMPASLSFTCQLPLKTPGSSSEVVPSIADILGKADVHSYPTSASHDKCVALTTLDRDKTPSVKDMQQRAGGTVLSMSVTGPHKSTSTVTHDYRAGPSSSPPRLLGANTPAYDARQSTASIPVTAVAQCRCTAALPHAVHDSPGSNTQLPSMTLQESSSAVSQPLWPPFNVPLTAAMKDHTAVSGHSEHLPSSLMPVVLSQQPHQSPNELEDHMTRLSQVLSILTETSGLQQTLAHHGTPSQVVVATSNRRIHGEQVIAADLMTPALRGQICSTLENVTSVHGLTTCPRADITTSEVIGATESHLTSSALDHMIPPSYGIVSTPATVAAMGSIGALEESLSSPPSLLSGNTPIVPTQTGQKDVTRHMILPTVAALLPSKLQNIPGYDAH